MYQRLGWKVMNVSHIRGDHAGYYLHLEREGEKLCVEVKGCSKLYQIPDLYSSEIDRETMRLIADELCVVYIVGNGSIQVARIPCETLLPEHVTIKYGYRISGKFKNERTIKPFIVANP
jgi:hypothetical protein